MSFIPHDLSRERLAEIQLNGLKWTVKHAYGQSPFYREHFDAAGVHPDGIRSMEDIQRLPLTEK